MSAIDSLPRQDGAITGIECMMPNNGRRIFNGEWVILGDLKRAVLIAPVGRSETVRKAMTEFAAASFGISEDFFAKQDDLSRALLGQFYMPETVDSILSDPDLLDQRVCQEMFNAAQGAGMPYRIASPPPGR